MKKPSFQAFYEENFEKVYRFIFFRVQMNKEVAEDLTSEIFIKALKNFEKYDPSVSKSAWIMTISRNHLYNHYRDTKTTVDIDEIAFALPGADGRRELELTDDRLAILEALEQLEKKDRELIELKYIQGFAYKEIAVMIGKTTGAARIEAHRAMKKLRNILEKKYD